MLSFKRLLSTAVLGGTLAISATFAAQAAYPERPVTLIVSFVVGHRCWPVFVVLGIVVVRALVFVVVSSVVVVNTP